MGLLKPAECHFYPVLHYFPITWFVLHGILVSRSDRKWRMLWCLLPCPYSALHYVMAMHISMWKWASEAALLAHANVNVWATVIHWTKQVGDDRFQLNLESVQLETPIPQKQIWKSQTLDKHWPLDFVWHVLDCHPDPPKQIWIVVLDKHWPLDLA